MILRLPQHLLPALRALGLIAAAGGSLIGAPGLEAAPLPPAPPLNPAWAFDPNGPVLPGTAAPSLLLPGGGLPFNPMRPSQPQAISGPRPQIPPCPLIVPPPFFALQPLHIPPAQVPLKNSFGCLSPDDAVYGPDGCPRRLCGTKLGTKIPLPPGGP